MTLQPQARQQFLREYRHVRYAEHRGSDDSAYYRALPYTDLSGRNSAMWAMRARTYRYFERHILTPREKRLGRPLEILDLGAGNAWMSYRLSLRGHNLCALDIFSDPKDGLRAARHYTSSFACIEADFHCLPFAENSFDVVIFNSSLHYSTDYVLALSEVRRSLRPAGKVVILDSPIYKCGEHGQRMVAERHATFLARYGFRSDAIPSIEFLDEEILQTLAHQLHLQWRIYKPWYGWRWHIRALKAYMQRRRPPSRFWILVGAFQR
jgi:ubiquinone/menaquinone biosynthesis C-methylase UbiE